MTRASHDLEESGRVGGHPALDFVNTVDRWEHGLPGDEYLVDYAALASWHDATGMLDAAALRELKSGSAAAKRNAWRQALKLRETLYRLFAARATGRSVRQEDLDELQSVLLRTFRWRRLSVKGRHVVSDWDFADAPPAAILGPVAWSVAELLQQGPLDRIKACPPGDGCGWLFLDLSKNRSRTWCSMKTCGNVAKVRRFRARR